METVFFETQLDFRKWLESNHDKANEIIVGFYKVKSGKPSMTWSESVDQALCFGWIDGIRRSIDEESYCIRFTPRRASSNWSAINIKKVAELIKIGQMQPAGLEIYNKRRGDKSEIYSFENDTQELSEDMKILFKENTRAWEFFINQSPSYRKTVIHWIMSAKQSATRQSRLERIIAECINQKRLWGR